MGGIGQDTADAIVRRALDQGVNFIDTANVYHEGRSEEILDQSLRNLGVKRSDVVIATKVCGTMGKAHILDQVEQSLRRLNTDYIDLYQIHANDPVTPIEETLWALDDCVRRGLVRYVGVSNWSAWRIQKALGISERRGFARFESVQAYYSIAGRDLERELVPMINEEGLGLMVWSPLAGGLLTGKYHPETGEGDKEGRRATFNFPPVDEERTATCIAAMREVANQHGVSVAQVALAWLLHQGHVTSVIVGAKRLDQLDENLGAIAITFTEGDLAKLGEVSRLPAEYPGWMLDVQGERRIPKPFAPEAQ
jgi:aryl-alcohol dehydrogenase-like predicted oxidoreductase